MANQVQGLKKLRKNTEDRKPTFHCDNCKCNRYSVCGCQKRQKRG